MKTRRFAARETLAGAILRGAVAGLALATLPAAAQQADAPRTTTAERPEMKGPDLTGIYQIVPNDAALPGGLRNQGSPEEISLKPEAAAEARARNPKDDVAKLCMPVGPFRMMAWDGNKIDVYRSPGRITMLFENYFLGHMRTIYLDRPHTQGPPLWVGDSVGRWDGETLVVDTNRFNEYTRLNSAGAPHSEDLLLTERFRLVDGGKYLEVRMTAEDPKVLTAPYTYTRYYERVNTEIQEDICNDDLETVE
jgi:hypothetical protein